MTKQKTNYLLTADIVVVEAGGVVYAVLQGRTVEVVLRTVKMVAGPASAVAEILLATPANQLSFLQSSTGRDAVSGGGGGGGVLWGLRTAEIIDRDFQIDKLYTTFD